MSEDLPGPSRTFRMTPGRRIGDALIGQLIRVGVVPHSYLMTTIGRKTGQPRTTPVTIVEWAGRRWLVAPYGPVSWVHNARAAGWVTLRRAGRSTRYTVRAAQPEEAGPVLKQYVEISRPTRPYFRAAPDAPVDQFIAEADQHPVFELTPVTPASTGG
ncbi:MAG TPA: nitroreductase family deazaflavin-dependent oxidoreductase [Kineosporiaceae bacterium]|nr:nitroreductase family deazaflavin-dependent oxidoreductase [Kineosporiaceae bacterium]